jgi:hypothetical protein
MSHSDPKGTQVSPWYNKHLLVTLSSKIHVYRRATPNSKIHDYRRATRNSKYRMATLKVKCQASKCLQWVKISPINLAVSTEKEQALFRIALTNRTINSKNSVIIKMQKN